MSIINLRELGGYENQHGLKIKEGVFFRSGLPDISNRKLKKLLDSFNIKKVYDLRTDAEISNKSYKLPDNIEYGHHPVFDNLGDEVEKLGLGSGNKLAMIKTLRNIDLNQDEIDKVKSYMSNLYKDMGKNPEIFGIIIGDMIENEGRPSLFHCTAGKDRTGVLAAIIMQILGISKDKIMENYLLSNLHGEAAFAKERSKLRLFIKDAFILDMIGDFMKVKEDYLKTFFDYFNSEDNFTDEAREKLGLSKLDIERFKELYLIKG